MDGSTRLVLRASLVLLALTAVSGALHGVGLIHSTEDGLHGAFGIVGWLGLAVLAVVAHLVAATPPRPLAWAAIGALCLYAVATPTGLRAAAAAATFVAIVGFAAGLVPALRSEPPVTVPHLGALAALVVLATLPLLDLLPEVTGIGGADWVPFRVAGARSPSIVTVAVLAGTALVESLLAPTGRPAGTWGLAQVLVLVVGWLTLLAGTAADSLDLLVASVLFHAVGVVVFLVRIVPGLAGDRWAAVAVVWLAAHLGLLGHLALGVADGRYLELAVVPGWLLFAVDHVVFVGLVGNAMLGWAGAGTVALSAVNTGLAGVTIGLAAGVTGVSRAAAVVLAVGLVLGAAAGLAPSQRAERRWPAARGPS